MATVKVLRGFRDLKRHVDRKVGDTFEVSDERAAQIANALPGYVTYEATRAATKTDSAVGGCEPAQADNVAENGATEPQTDYAKLKVAELRKLCEERGIPVAGRPKKAELIALLEE